MLTLHSLLFLSSFSIYSSWTGANIVATNPKFKEIYEINEDVNSLTPDHFLRGSQLEIRNPPRELCTPPVENPEHRRNKIVTEDLKVRKWPNGIVYYDLSLTDTSGKYTTLSDKQKNALAQAMTMIQSVSCLVFLEYTSSSKSATNFIQIRRSIAYECTSSRVGMAEPGSVGKPAAQYIYLSDGCFKYTGTIIHEILHAVGFHHEHSRQDRGNYIVIHEKNIKKELLKQFYLHPPPSGNYNGNYDLGSLMHYAPGAAASSGNSFDVLKNITLPSVSLGQRLNFTSEDIRKINVFYECGKVPKTSMHHFEDVQYMRALKGLKCGDLNMKCQKWAKQNFCNDERTLIFMSRICRKSCNFCN